jgi:hypothetical protein
MANVSWSGREVNKNYGGEILDGISTPVLFGGTKYTLRFNANIVMPLSCRCLDATCSKACANDRTVI